MVLATTVATGACAGWTCRPGATADSGRRRSAAGNYGYPNRWLPEADHKRHQLYFNGATVQCVLRFP
uniref:Putative secreted protein n=1 Tax=Anopheles triannulatus TaxID=58253 RepID=A0A2M4B5P9_9DIPT